MTDEINIVSYYLLPLLELNFKSFKSFKNCYLSIDLQKLIVILAEKEEDLYFHHPNFVADVEEVGEILIIFSIPNEYSETVEFFIKGEYTKFPEEVKRKIRKYSGLPYKRKITKADGKTAIETAEPLMGLVLNHPSLKKVVQERIGQDLPKDVELISIPRKKDFYIL